MFSWRHSPDFSGCALFVVGEPHDGQDVCDSGLDVVGHPIADALNLREAGLKYSNALIVETSDQPLSPGAPRFGYGLLALVEKREYEVFASWTLDLVVLLDDLAEADSDGSRARGTLRLQIVCRHVVLQCRDVALTEATRNQLRDHDVRVHGGHQCSQQLGKRLPLRK